MVDLKINSTRRFDKSTPKIKFEKEEIGISLLSIFNTNKNVYDYFGLVLLKLGFEPEDNVLICNYDDKNSSFDCIVNNKDNYNIRVDNTKTDNCGMEIVINRFNMEYGYECVPLEYSEIGMKVSLSRYSIRYSNGIVFTRFLSRNKAKYMTEFNDYILEFELEKPRDVKLPLFDDNGSYAKYKLDSEGDLIEYLSCLAINKSLLDIYSDICNLYIEDIDRYPDLSFKISSSCDNKVRDLVCLKNGELERFVITIGNKTVLLNNDGSCYYEKEDIDSLINFSINISNGRKSYNINLNTSDEIDKNTRMLIERDMLNASREINEVKKRVKLLFNKKGSN